MGDERGDLVRVKVWGARGSVPTPGPWTNRDGGNTSCLQVALSDGRLLVLDAGSGIRNLGLRLAGRARQIDIVLTHLHLDHIQGPAPARKSARAETPPRRSHYVVSLIAVASPGATLGVHDGKG